MTDEQRETAEPEWREMTDEEVMADVRDVLEANGAAFVRLEMSDAEDCLDCGLPVHVIAAKDGTAIAVAAAPPGREVFGEWRTRTERDRARVRVGSANALIFAPDSDHLIFAPDSDHMEHVRAHRDAVERLGDIRESGPGLAARADLDAPRVAYEVPWDPYDEDA